MSDTNPYETARRLVRRPACTCPVGECVGPSHGACRRDVARDARDLLADGYGRRYIAGTTDYEWVRPADGCCGECYQLGQPCCMEERHEPRVPSSLDPRCRECFDLGAAYCDVCAPRVFAAGEYPYVWPAAPKPEPLYRIVYATPTPHRGQSLPWSVLLRYLRDMSRTERQSVVRCVERVAPNA